MYSSDIEKPGLKYINLAAFLRGKIQTGAYRPGDRMPNQPDLAKQLNVSLSTLTRALNILEEEGYLSRKTGQGTFIKLPEQRKPTALVVDDEENIRGFLRRTLEKLDWECSAVGSGEEAIPIVREKRPEVVFLDLMMAGMNGAETFRCIHDLHPSANVVIVTAYPQSELLARALEIGPFALIRKPISTTDILEVIAT